MARIVVQNNTRENIPKSQPAPQVNKKVVIEDKKRDLPNRNSYGPPDPVLMSKTKSFISNGNSHYYLGFGGAGDAVLLLASCWDDPKARVIFFANNIPFINKIHEAFNKPVFLYRNIMGNKWANAVYDVIVKSPNFRQSAHLADGLFYGDWSNQEKYKKRIVSYAPWIDKFGKIEEEKPVLILAPSGSSKDTKRQRFLTVNEYKKLIAKYSDHKIYSVGSTNDLSYYGMQPEVDWVTAEKIYRSNKSTENSTVKNMFKIINSASKVISMDTWLKTYTLLCGIPTTVIRTRWSGNYLRFGVDVTDYIFINENIWNFLSLEKIEDLIK